MNEEGKLKDLAAQIVLESKMAQKAICMLISMKSSMCLFFSGVFVAISCGMLLQSIDINYASVSLFYIIFHFTLIILSFLATFILTYIADLSQSINKSVAFEYCRLTFDENAASDKKNEFENSLKDAFNISGDINNNQLSKALKRTYILKIICYIVAPICFILIVILIILKNPSLIIELKEIWKEIKCYMCQILMERF